VLLERLDGGVVRGNMLSSPQGSRVLNCPDRSMDYAVGHVRNGAMLQSGYRILFFDFGSRCE